MNFIILSFFKIIRGVAIANPSVALCTANPTVKVIAEAISPKEFGNLALKFKDEYANKEVPEGVDVYIAAQKWFFTPAKII